MDLFKRAKTIRLRSYKDKYLIAEDDQESVCQHRDGTTNNALWTIEFVQGRDLLRFKSCYGRYLTASNNPFLPGATGKQVLQTLPSKFDPAIEWEPLRDGMQVRLRTLWGDFLRPNGGLPPWRNSVTHDIPRWQKSYNKVLWDVEVVEAFPVHRRARSDSTFFKSRSSVSA
ncbi:hypothetical protein Fot_25154 [Forsythia ovata]|uniref:DUF569 domain-containing protein n=1 Tax=Forsythia ovata TaxID=205694 RepID=A0ABD1U866_9LAMI